MSATASPRALVVDRAAGELGGGVAEGSGIWSAEGGTIEARLKATGIRLERLPWLPPALSDLETTASGELEVSGRTTTPSGRARLAFAGSVFEQQPLPDLALEAVADGHEVRLDGRSGQAPLLSGRMPLADPWPLHIDLDLAALPLTTLLRTVPALARVEAAVALDGRASIDLPLRAPRDLRYDARVDALRAHLGREWQAGPFTLSGDRQAFALAGLRIESGRSRLTAEGGVGLEATAPAPLEMHGELALGDLAPLLPDGELGGIAALDLRVEGTASGPELTGGLRVSDGTGQLGNVRLEGLQIEGHVGARELAVNALSGGGLVTGLALASGSEKLDLQAPAAWAVERGLLTLAPLRLRGPKGHLDIEGRASAAGAVPDLQVAVAGETDLSVLDPFLSSAATLAGPVRVDLRVKTGPRGLDLDGELTVADARLVLATPPVAITHLKGTIRGRGRTVEIAEWSGELGDGRVGARGQVTLEGKEPAVDLALHIDRVPLSYPEGLRSRVSGDLRLSGQEGRYRLAGDVAVLRALYQRETDRASQSLDQVGWELEALDRKGSPLERVQLDVRVELEDGLRVENKQMHLVVDGGVSVGGTLLAPEVGGAVTLREGGTVQLGRARLRLTQGRVELAGYPSRPPELDIAGITRVGGIAIDASVTGPLDDFSMSLSARGRSDLTQGDLATLILTGRTASAAASESGAIVAEELAASLASALDKKLGGAVYIDVSRDESLLVDDTDPTQRLNIGVPIGPKLYVVYSQALDGADQRWILDFRPGAQLRLRLIEDQNEGTSVEVTQRRSFDLWSRGSRASPEAEIRPRVHAVSIEGAPAGQAEALRRKADVQTGNRYDYFVGEEAAARVRSALVAGGYLAALVEARERPAGPGTVDVVFVAETGPRIRVEWTGDEPGKDARKQAASGWDPYLPPEDTAQRLARTVRHRLEADRWFQAAVTARVTREGEGVRAVFDVRLGPRGDAAELRFEGNPSVDARVLAAALPPRKSPELFALLDPEGHARLESALRIVYAQRGFLEARAAAPQRSFDAAGGLRVTIPVDEGRPALVAAIELPEDLPAAASALRLRVGQPFNVDAYVGDRGRLASWYRDQGYPDVRVAGVLEPVKGGLAVRFAVEPGPLARVGEIRVARKGRTRPSVVDDAVTLRPGDPVRARELARSRENLADTRVFRSADVRAEPTGEVRDVVVDLVDKRDVDVEYGLRYVVKGSNEVGGVPTGSNGGRLQATAAIELPSPFGLAHRYRAFTYLGSERTLYGLTFDSATFFGLRWRTQVFLYDDEDLTTQIASLAQRVQGVTLQQTQRWRSELAGRRWSDRLRMQWGYFYKHIRYTDVESGRQLLADRAGLTDALVGDSRDSLTDPHRGLFWSLGGDLGLRALGSDVSYVKLYGQLFAYVPLGPRVVWAQGLRLGAVPGNDPVYLLDNRFQAGGSTTVRGFPESGLGPHTADGVALGGQALAVFNEELRFPLWKRLYGGVFYDAGNVFALAREMQLGSLRHSAGAGLRLMFPFGPVRLDWGYILDPEPGEKRWRWVLTLGQAF